ncbi:phage shock protein D [Rouxiella sp. S1S-2]|uniref:phage shock protein PspD n=1 Tax=Rouxiella sp. S1S-2 TaxID=2653856 RepID=UPI0012653445|nr:phage shock protein PspD [Rouxiella sp. S1S-2]KAB7896177.1 phage shock protein D [Rouxiella sp. S1S-2]
MRYASAVATSAKSGLLKKAFKFIIMVVLTFAPAGVAAKVLGVLGRGPLRYLLALFLEPLVRRILTAVFGRYARERNEKTTK